MPNSAVYLNPLMTHDKILHNAKLQNLLVGCAFVQQLPFYTFLRFVENQKTADVEDLK